MARLSSASIALALIVLAGPAAAQQTSSVTQADITRLQDNVYLAERDVSQFAVRDPSRATDLRSELDDLRDEVIYLKVKLRKERSVARSEFADVRDRIDNLRSRARGEAAGTSSASPRPPAPAVPAAGSGGAASSGRQVPPSASGSQSRPEPPAPGTAGRSSAFEIPAGTEIDVRLQKTLNSGTAMVEDRFEGTTLVDLSIDDRTVVPAGSVVRGIVSSVDPASRTNRTAHMALSFDELIAGGRTYQIRGSVTEALEGEGIKGEVGRIGAGAGVGAIIGGILGGFKGALAGILIGGGGIVAATEGKEIDLPQGTVLRVRFDSPVALQTGR